MQREVADRLAAPPGSRAYGALSVGVQATCRVERLLAVRAGAFHPAPRVASALVRLTPRPDPVVSPAEAPAFRAFVTACFYAPPQAAPQRRHGRDGTAGGGGARGLAQLGLDPTARPETLAPEQFARLLRWGRGL